MPFGGAAQRLDDAPAHQAEVARIERDRYLGHPLDDAVERARGSDLEGALASARAPDRIHDVVPLAPLANECVHELGRILQVSVHQHDGVASRDLDARGRGELVPEVSRQVHQHDVPAPAHLVADRRQRAVGAAVVDQDDLEIEGVAQALRHAGDALEQRRDVALLVIERNDEAQDGTRGLGHSARRFNIGGCHLSFDALRSLRMNSAPKARRRRTPAAAECRRRARSVAACAESARPYVSPRR